MGGRGLVIATGLFCVLAGLIFWSNKRKAAEDTKTPASTAPQVLRVPQADITGITIQKKNGGSVVLQKAGNDWRMTEPQPYPVDKDYAGEWKIPGDKLNPFSFEKPGILTISAWKVPEALWKKYYMGKERCFASGLLTLRKVRSADPADLFA